MLPSAHPATRAISRVVAAPRPRSLMILSAAWRIWPRVSPSGAKGDRLFGFAGRHFRFDVASHEYRRDDRRNGHPHDGNHDPHVQGMDERTLSRVEDGDDPLLRRPGRSEPFERLKR